MKGLIILLILISTATFASHNHNMKNMKNKNVVKTKKMKTFLSPYFVIQQMLVDSKTPSKKDIKALEVSLHKKIRMTKDAEMKKSLKKAEKFVEAMLGKDLKEVRGQFFELSKVLIPLTKKMKLKGVQAYYCPMANKTWIQNQSNITYNPYMPKKMLHCGSKI